MKCNLLWMGAGIMVGAFYGTYRKEVNKMISNMCMDMKKSMMCKDTNN